MAKEHWSEDGMIHYDEFDEGWALDNNCQTICLCQKNDSSNKVLFGEVSLDSITNPKQREALGFILQYRKENGYGQQDTERSVIRGGSPRTFEYREASIKQPTIK